MEQIIFSKYSNERNRDLAIRTDIVKVSEGMKYVRKMPAYPEAKTHVEKLLNWEEKLTNKYANTCICMNHGEKQGDGVAFEFVAGETLEEKLDTYYYAGQYDELIALLSKYIQMIQSVNSVERFVPTKEFAEIFGVCNVAKKLTCSDVNNIDMIVGNVIIDGDKWHIIDYEWTFDIKIPVNFIIYRIIFYYVYATAKRDVLHGRNLYALFDISEQEIQVYEEMERSFQQYIVKDVAPIRNLYGAITPGTVTFEQVKEQYDIQKNQMQFRVYLDKGNGFLDEDAFICGPQESFKNLMRYELHFPQRDVRAIRMVPLASPYVMRLERSMGYAGSSYHIPIQGGLKFGDNIYAFAGENNFFDISDVREHTSAIYLDMVKQYVPGNILTEIEASYTEKIEAAQQEVRDAQQEVRVAKQQQAYFEQELCKTQLDRAEINHQLFLAQSEVHALRGSLSYRVMAPFRKISGPFIRFGYKHPGFKATIKSMLRVVRRGPKRAKEIARLHALQRRITHIAPDMNALEPGYLIGDASRYIAKEQCQYSFEIFACVSDMKDYEYRKMIESVLAQNVEAVKLNIIDSSSAKDNYYLFKEYACYDKRIVYQKSKAKSVRSLLAAQMKQSKADYLLVMQQGDILLPNALSLVCEQIDAGQKVVYFDECVFKDTIQTRVASKFKPDFSPDFITSHNYIGSAFVMNHALYIQIGGLCPEKGQSAMYDLILRLAAAGANIGHVTELVYYSHLNEQDLFATDEKMDRQVIAEYLHSIGRVASVENGEIAGVYHPKYAVTKEGMVSILIPNKDHIDDLKRCLDSLRNKTSYSNYEIIVIENNSTEEETFAYYKEIEQDARIQIVYWDDIFNYSGINNFGAQYAKGEYVLLLNNDVEIINAEWLTEMVSYAQREDVGAVGARLYYPDDTIQHAGVVVGLGGVAGHAHRFFTKDNPGYLNRIMAVNNFTACTAACLLMRKAVFDEVEGLDVKYQVAYNDVDLCCRICAAGYLVVYTPFAELHHYESVSRGLDDTPEKRARYLGEVERFQTQWANYIAYDPYYNPNLTVNYEDFREK